MFEKNGVPSVKTFEIKQRNGTIHTVIVDDEDYESIRDYRWCVTERKYVFRNPTKDEGKSSIRLHRQLMNAPKDYVVDHINRNPLDNRKENLRIVTVKKNAENANLRKRNKSGFSGVEYRNGKWEARIKHNKKSLHLGRFSSFEDAIAARKAKEIELNWLTNIRN